MRAATTQSIGLDWAAPSVCGLYSKEDAVFAGCDRHYDALVPQNLDRCAQTM